MSNSIKSGTGYSIHSIDRENKTIRIDFSGNPDSNDPIFDKNDGCFRNDASILFFVANSYKSAFLSLGRDIDNRFEKYIEKDIEHLILPYYYNFRHYVETELKAIYVAVTNKSPELKHDFSILLSLTEKAINEISYGEIDNSYLKLSEEGFNEIKSNALSIFDNIKTMINQYISIEPAVEYYRYIFENEKNNGDRYMVLNNPVIQLDYPKTNQLFCSIRDSFDILCKKLREIIYIYFTL